MFEFPSIFLYISSVGALQLQPGPLSSSNLPRTYDPTKLQHYFDTRPGILFERAFQLTGDLASVFLGVGADALRAPLLCHDVESTEMYWSCVWRNRGASVRRALENGGPTFVKFGQALASRGDLIGDVLARELLPLQDQLQPFDSTTARSIIKNELGNLPGDYEDLLQSLTFEPVAAASVSQVYKGSVVVSPVAEEAASVARKRREGPSSETPRAVAVKVQRPDSRLMVASDAVLMRSVASALEGLRVPAFRQGGSETLELSWEPVVKAAAVAAVDEFFSRLFEEMDFVNEASNLELFGRLYDSERGSVKTLPWPGVRVPRVYTELCSENVLVMDWVEGEKLSMAFASPVPPLPLVEPPPQHLPVPLAAAAVAAAAIEVTGETAATPKTEVATAALPEPTSNPQGGLSSQRESASLALLASRRRQETDLALVRLCIDATLCQLLDSGVMHADPHGGNLLRVPFLGKSPPPRLLGLLLPQTLVQRARRLREAALGVGWWAASLVRRRSHPPPAPPSPRILSGSPPPPSPVERPLGEPELPPAAYQLAYLDMGLVSRVPVSVREGLMCAVVLMVERRFDAVAELFADLLLLPRRVLDDPLEAAAFKDALDRLAAAVLDFGDEGNSSSGSGSSSSSGGGSAGGVPQVRFERLLLELLALAPRFEFQLPPYFLNNARALGTLEGMALSVDPSFNILSAVYPFALRRLLANPSASPRLAATLDLLVHGEARDRRETSAPGDSLMTEGDESISTPSRLDDNRAREIRWRELWRLGRTASKLSGVPRRAVMREVLSTGGGRRFVLGLVKEQLALSSSIAVKRAKQALSRKAKGQRRTRPMESRSPLLQACNKARVDEINRLHRK